MSDVTHATHSNRLYLVVWVALLVITVIEIAFAYRHLPVALMLTLLMGLSLVKAGLIMAYFMHLRYEKPSLVLTLIPSLVICIILLLIFFPDSLRILELGT